MVAELYEHKDPRNPNRFGGVSQIWVAPTDLDRYVSAIALNVAGSAAGSALTILAGGWCPGTGQSVWVTPSAAVTVTLDISGILHNGDTATEQLVFTASATAQATRRAFRRVTRVEVISRSSSANTIQVGVSVAANGYLGLPLRPEPQAVAGDTSAPMTGEVVGLVFQDGTPMTVLADASASEPSINPTVGTIRLGDVAIAGPAFVMWNRSNIGARMP